jgi:hypothetical protein
MKRLQDGTIAVKGDSFPAFLYPHDGYDPDDLNFGLLRGPILLCVCGLLQVFIVSLTLAFLVL